VSARSLAAEHSGGVAPTQFPQRSGITFLWTTSLCELRKRMARLSEIVPLSSPWTTFTSSRESLHCSKACCTQYNLVNKFDAFVIGSRIR